VRLKAQNEPDLKAVSCCSMHLWPGSEELRDWVHTLKMLSFVLFFF